MVQNSKLRFMTCREIFLFGLNFTDSPSAANWAWRCIQNYPTIPLPETFEELLKVPLDRPCNFLMSLDKDSIDKEMSRQGVEALMFWELPKVENALTLEIPDVFESRKRGSESRFRDSKTEKWAFSGTIFKKFWDRP